MGSHLQNFVAVAALGRQKCDVAIVCRSYALWYGNP